MLARHVQPPRIPVSLGPVDRCIACCSRKVPKEVRSFGRRNAIERQVVIEARPAAVARRDELAQILSQPPLDRLRFLTVALVHPRDLLQRMVVEEVTGNLLRDERCTEAHIACILDESTQQ